MFSINNKNQWKTELRMNENLMQHYVNHQRSEMITIIIIFLNNNKN